MMICHSNDLLENCLLTCPFSHICNLPKMEDICNFPEYKVCTEYEIKLNRLKSTTKILY
ncbi:MAG: hypothetical protein ACFFA8_06590 [Promethearchaeota archaeon]